ncbi:predicted protein [Plenodomus lingam JN3]|uniref:Uncharacterized protein n=1 Tax=Leptosphaeria maculans (strain JN3 / isolate v23.1.3 / race Av1-4-5-6-7-8) TaxID=985895 RepID=E5A6J5_LEPMJ|nr:predicted protein [Plenodomus lingam JN3]CBX99240.1 predicted protein [Plenodomus lingam JN3]
MGWAGRGEGQFARRGGMSYDHGFSVGRLGLYSKC